MPKRHCTPFLQIWIGHDEATNPQVAKQIVLSKNTCCYITLAPSHQWHSQQEAVGVQTLKATHLTNSRMPQSGMHRPVVACLRTPRKSDAHRLR
jgi:hypothetical protein